MAVIKISSRACLESNATRHCSTDAQERTVSKLETLANKLGVPLRFGTLVGKYPQTIILDYNYQDGAVRVSSNGSFEINGEEFGSYDSYFSFSRVNIDDVKNALLSLKEESGESEESLNESKSEFTEVLDVLKSFGDLLEPDDISPDNITGTFNEEDLSKIKKKLKSLGFKYDSDRASFFSKDRFFEITLDDGEFEINEIFDEEDSEDESLGESLHESKDIYADSQIRYELEQVLDYLEDSAGAFKKILSSNRWNETATDSLVDDMKDCFNRVKKIAYSLDSDRYSMFDGR